MQRHMQAGGVHHDEHGAQALAGLADDGTHRFVKTHHASGAAVQAHFFFDAVAVHATARTVGVELGHQKQRQAFGPRWRIGQAGQHQVHDVVGQVVFAARDENLGAAHCVTTIGHGDRFGAGQAQVGAGVWLGQAHGGQPFAGGHFVQIQGFEFVAGVVFDALVGAVQQAGRHGPAMVGGAQHFVEHGFKHAGQALAAVLRARRQSGPACLPKSLVSRFETGRHGDHAVFPLRANFVATAVQRRDHFAHELARFIQHLLHQFGVDLGKGR